MRFTPLVPCPGADGGSCPVDTLAEPGRLCRGCNAAKRKAEQQALLERLAHDYPEAA